MGRNSNPRTKKTTGTPLQVSSFFTKETAPQEKGRDTPQPPKMADSEPPEEDGTTLTKQDFLQAMRELKGEISDQIQQSIQQAIQPLSDELKTITNTLAEVSQAAETALEGAMAAHRDIQQLQNAEVWARDKIMALENKLKERNIKFRGFPESVEGEEEIKIFIATWLAKTLDLEDNVAPIIDHAYRVGPITKRNLKPIVQKLNANSIRFRWSSPSELLVIHQGQRLSAIDLQSGCHLLRSLNIDFDFQDILEFEPEPTQEADSFQRWIQVKKKLKS
ncbi:UNVERIFIED_CONTAM: hypothetical protein K2H54_049943 [Gekko kuhli]